MHYLTLLLFIYLFAWVSPVYTQSASGQVKDSISFFQSLQKDELAELTLLTNQKKFIREKKKEQYQPAALIWKSPDGQEITYEVEIKSRGNMRLNTCYYPPIRLKLHDKYFSDGQFSGARKLKVVVACKGGVSYEQLVLKEYLAYRIYNLLSDLSFQVQLIKLTVKDTEEKVKDRTSLAFVIEDEDDMAQRIGGKIFDPKSISRKGLENESYHLLALFQYLIGNTDWFVLNKHNTKFVITKDPPAMIPIPYDFDFAGAVNAPYAVPHEKIPISSVSERYFIGECDEENGYDKTIGNIISQQKEIIQLIEKCEHLNQESSRQLLNFLETSFEIINNPKKIKAEIAKGCGWSPLDR